MSRAIPLIGMIVLMVLFAQPPAPVRGQQSPLVGIWSSNITDAYGKVQGVVFMAFAAHGELYRKLFPRSVGSGGAVFQEWGEYRLLPSGAAIQWIVERYAPHQCIAGWCEPYMPYVGHWVISYVTFQGRNTVAFRDQGNSGPPQVYIRQSRIP
jgi:hypothetical protein